MLLESTSNTHTHTPNTHTHTHTHKYGKCRAAEGTLGPSTKCYEDIECKHTRKGKKHGKCEKGLVARMDVFGDPSPGTCAGEFSHAGVEAPAPADKCATKGMKNCGTCVEAGCAWCYAQAYARLGSDPQAQVPAGQCVKSASVCPNGAQYYSAQKRPAFGVHGSGTEVVPYYFEAPEKCPVITKELMQHVVAKLYPGEGHEALRRSLADNAKPNERFWMMRPFMMDSHFDEAVQAVEQTRMETQTDFWTRTLYGASIGQRKEWNDNFAKTMQPEKAIRKYQPTAKFASAKYQVSSVARNKLMQTSKPLD